MAIYKVYKAKDSVKWFQMPHWVTLLDSLNLIGSKSGVSLVHAKLLFMWSQV